MPATRSAAKRLLLGRAFSSESLVRERLPKRLALPAFSADSLSSVAYAPDEIMIALALGGASLMVLGPWVALAVVLVLAVVVVAMRSSIREYPDGGGDYAVVSRNLGPRAGRISGASLLIDYVLTVAVSLSQSGAYAASAAPVLRGYETVVSLVLLAVLTVLSLRGVRESGRLLALPMYLFIGMLGVMLAAGAVQGALGMLPEPAQPGAPMGTDEDALTALGAALLIARAFAGGCAALTGVEAISNAVPNFQPPKARNAATTLVIMGSIAATMLLGVVLLARSVGVVLPDGEATLRSGPKPEPVVSQTAGAVFGEGSALALLTVIATAVVLCLAANTAFQSFPQLASTLAKDGFLPRQLRLRGDRLAFSNGILMLAAGAAVAILASGGRVSTLVHMYVVGVFISMALAQRGMVRHCTRRIRVENRGRRRRVLARQRLVALIALSVICAVLVVVLAGKLMQGGWVAVVVIGGLGLLMTLIHHHYRAVAAELALSGPGERVTQPAPAQPSRSHAIVLLSRLDRASMLALTTALAARHLSVQAVTVDDGETDTAGLVERWREHEVPIPLRLVYSPYRDLWRPVRSVIHVMKALNPGEGIVVYLQQIEVRHWWEWVLHNHSARRLSALLAEVPGVRVVTVPWRLGRAEVAQGPPMQAAHGYSRAEADDHAPVAG